MNVVLIDAGHLRHAGLDDRTYEGALVRVAWHEWAHALGVVRATADDVAEGSRLLDRAPSGVREGIRRAGYRRRDYTHELIAETNSRGGYADGASDTTRNGEPPTPPVGYVLSDEHGMRQVLEVEADLLQREGIDPEWPGFAEESAPGRPRA